MSGQTIESSRIITCRGRSGFFKLAKVKVDIILDQVIIGFKSRKEPKTPPMLLSGNIEEVKKLLQHILSTIEVLSKEGDNE